MGPPGDDELATRVEPGRSVSVSGAGSVVGAAQVGRYELLLQLASGGMATVFLGRQRGAGGFERVVAIKRMHPHVAAVPELASAFMDEARIASQIQHPNVVQVQDVHESEGERLLVMEYVDGASLSVLSRAARKKKMRVPRPIALYVLVHALDGLHAAHEQRGLDGRPLEIVHRDATPQNILIGVDGAVKITDFGIARAAERSTETVGGQVKGKFRYMAPEQARGGAIDRRLDVFAMGVVAWELLANAPFLSGDSDAAVLQQIAMADFRVLHEVDPTTPSDLSAIVMRALEKRPDDRFATADAFARALEGWARARGEMPTPADVASFLDATAGEAILQRRTQLMDTLSGKVAPVVPGMSAFSTTGSVSRAFTDVAPDAVAAAAPSSKTGALAALALCGAALIAVLAFVFIPRPAPPAPPTPTVGAAPAASQESATVARRVGVTIASRVSITSIRAPGIADIAFVESGATLTLPMGNEPVTLQIKLSDGTETTEVVTPQEAVALQLRAPTKATDKPKPGARAADPKTEPRAQPAVAPPPAGAPPLRKNPYDD